MLFRLWKFLGNYGFLRHPGRAPNWWPSARVRYPDGEISVVMPIGNAADYRTIFGGELIPPNTPSSDGEKK